MIAARSLLHGEHWAGTKKSTSAADAEKCFYLLSVRFYQLPSGLLYTSRLIRPISARFNGMARRVAGISST
jgi:hypothetical protein